MFGYGSSKGLYIPKTAEEEIQEVIRNEPTCKSICLPSWKYVSTHSLNVMLDGLLTNTYCAEISLGEKNFDYDKMLTVVKHSLVITSLDLRDIKLGDATLVSLSSALSSNNTIKRLCLDDVDAPGAHHCFAEIIGYNVIENFILIFNEINAKGALDISNALKTNTSLTSLNLYANNIRVGGAEHIAIALFSNKTLKWLNISGNGIDRCPDTLLCALSTCSLNTFFFTANFKPEVANWRELDRAIMRNPYIEEAEYDSSSFTGSVKTSNALKEHFKHK